MDEKFPRSTNIKQLDEWLSGASRGSFIISNFSSCLTQTRHEHQNGARGVSGMTETDHNVRAAIDNRVAMAQAQSGYIMGGRSNQIKTHAPPCCMCDYFCRLTLTICNLGPESQAPGARKQQRKWSSNSNLPAPTCHFSSLILICISSWLTSRLL